MKNMGISDKWSQQGCGSTSRLFREDINEKYKTALIRKPNLTRDEHIATMGTAREVRDIDLNSDEDSISFFISEGDNKGIDSEFILYNIKVTLDHPVTVEGIAGPHFIIKGVISDRNRDALLMSLFTSPIILRGGTAITIGRFICATGSPSWRWRLSNEGVSNAVNVLGRICKMETEMISGEEVLTSITRRSIQIARADG